MWSNSSHARGFAMSEIGYPHGDHPGDTYPSNERPMPYMVESGLGVVTLTVCTPEKIILRMDLDYDEMVQFCDVLFKGIMSHVRQYR